MAIEYDKLNWQNEVTPVNATNLNRMEKGIDDAVNAINGMVSTLLDVFYPVGSYYETSDTEFNPNVSWGGIWTEDTSGRVLVAAGTNAGATYTAGATGGSPTAATGNHTLTTNQMPSHTHTQNAHAHGSPWSGASYLVANANIACNGELRHLPDKGGDCHMVYSNSNATINEYTATANATATNQYTGGGQAHNHGNVSTMQPYLVVKRWHRTA